MPYVSMAQARKFHSDPKLKKYAAEWDAATQAAGGFYKLPQYKKTKRHSPLAKSLAHRRHH